jgi:hypothetical protein
METHHSLRSSEVGSVVVDIGGDVGAAMVRAPAAVDGSEVEIRRCGTAWDGAHAAVRARHIPDVVIHAAFFDGLGHGNYEVRCRGRPGGTRCRS